MKLFEEPKIEVVDLSAIDWLNGTSVVDPSDPFENAGPWA